MNNQIDLVRWFLWQKENINIQIIFFTKLNKSKNWWWFSKQRTFLLLLKCRELSNLDLKKKKTHDTIWDHPLKFLLLKRGRLIGFFLESFNFKIKLRAKLNDRLEMGPKGR